MFIFVFYFVNLFLFSFLFPSPFNQPEASSASPNDLTLDLNSKSRSTTHYRQNQNRPDADKSSLGSIAASLLHKTPSAPSNVDAVIVSTRFVTLSWDRPDSTNGDVEGYSVFYKEAGSDR